MTQRQLNMIQALEEGLVSARDDLRGPGGEQAMLKAMEEGFDGTDRAYLEPVLACIRQL